MSRDAIQSWLLKRATHWQLRRRTLSFSSRPLLMGIVNVTPDSFSDGGQFLDRDRAIERGLKLVADGADLLDVGGESTRPYSSVVATVDELARVVPVLESLARQVSIPISIDTTKAAVAQAAIDAGAEIINDVSGLEMDRNMIGLARSTGVGVCAMHMQGVPQTMQDNPRYGNVVEEIHDYLRARRDTLISAGILPTRFCLDPGIGFGKTHQHNLTLLANSYRFHDLGCPLLVGHSRKGFIAHVIGDKEANRDPGTVGAALGLARQGVQILRVHNVADVRQALLLFEAAGGMRDL